jgi:hypothetical protein
MANGKQMINDLDFEEKIREFSPEARFLAREMYEMKKHCIACTQADTRQKVFNASGVAGFVAAIIIGVWEAVRRG